MAREAPVAPRDKKQNDKNQKEELPAGRLHQRIYESHLPAYRAQWRRTLCKYVEWETPRLARWQERVRHPVLDIFFLWTAAAGSHTAYMLGLPLFWWFGNGAAGRSTLYSLALSVYWSSFLKDALCVPRPFSPPLVRLSIGNHALEYGWPSTHSTTAVSTALSLSFIILPRLESELARWLVIASLVFYALSVIAGRLYAGMHSMVDCATGSILGILIFSATEALTPAFDAFCQQRSSIVLLTIVPVVLAMVTFYPQPVDNCPCFEDAVSFMGTTTGIALGAQTAYIIGRRPDMALNLAKQPDWLSVLLQLAIGLGRIVFGTAVVAAWRIAAKRTCQAVLPPIIRRLEPVFELPRRHYKRASEYIDYSKRPRDRSSELTGMSSISEAVQGGPFERTENPPTTRSPKGRARSASEALAAAMTPSPIHYDADVLTKLIVYTGIGWWASQGTAYLFPYVGLA